MLSIIIPIYNAENYIDECLKNLLENNLDIEILLINDGSKDLSHEKIEKYTGDSRIKYFRKENEGVSKARNLGLNNATGEYIMFLDADDYVKIEDLEFIINILNSKNPDCLQYGYRKFDDNNQTLGIEINGFLTENKVYSSKEFLNEMFNMNIRGYVWDKIFKRKIWEENNIRFETMKYCEDWYPMVACISKSKKILNINKPIYNYRQHENSAMHKKNPEAYKGYNKAATDILKDFGMFVDEENLKAFKGNAYGELIYYFDRNYEGKNLYSNYKNENLLSISGLEAFTALFNSQVQKRNKVAIILWKTHLYSTIKDLMKKR